MTNKNLVCNKNVYERARKDHCDEAGLKRDNKHILLQQLGTQTVATGGDK